MRNVQVEFTVQASPSQVICGSIITPTSIPNGRFSGR